MKNATQSEFKLSSLLSKGHATSNKETTKDWSQIDTQIRVSEDNEDLVVVNSIDKPEHSVEHHSLVLSGTVVEHVKCMHGIRMELVHTLVTQRAYYSISPKSVCKEWAVHTASSDHPMFLTLQDVEKVPFRSECTVSITGNKAFRTRGPVASKRAGATEITADLAAIGRLKRKMGSDTRSGRRNDRKDVKTTNYAPRTYRYSNRRLLG